MVWGYAYIWIQIHSLVACNEIVSFICKFVTWSYDTTSPSMCHCHKVPVLYFSMIWSAHQLRYVRKSAGVPTANARIRTCNLPIVSINQRKQWAAIQSADWWWKADWFIVLCHTVDKTAGSIWQSGINWGTYDNSSDMLHIFRSSKTDRSSNALWN